MASLNKTLRHPERSEGPLYFAPAHPRNHIHQPTTRTRPPTKLFVILSAAKDPCISPLPIPGTISTNRQPAWRPPTKTLRHPERSEGPLYFALAHPRNRIHQPTSRVCPPTKLFVILSAAKDPCISPSPAQTPTNEPLYRLRCTPPSLRRHKKPNRPAC